MRMLFFFLAFSFLIASCKKEYHVVGRVYNPITDEGFSGIKVEFSRTTIGELPGGFEEVTSTLTDANGFYEIKYKGRAERVKLDGTVEFYELGSLYTGIYQQVVPLDPNKIQWVDWHIVPYGKLILNIENVNCEGATDTMVFRSKGQFDEDYPNWSALKRIGCYTYTSAPPYTSFPMGYRYYEMKVTRPSGTTYVYDTVFIPSTGTAQIDLFY